MRILSNARIYTLDHNYPVVTGLVIDQGRIVAAGESQLLLSEFEGQVLPQNIHNLNGKAIIPGLTDAHLHLEQYALNLQQVDCETASRAECLSRVADRAHITSENQWVRGHGWNQNYWPEGFGSANDLDAAVPAHPVYLTAKSLHAAWANSQALRLAGVGITTPDPPDGRIGRDENGKPNGILFESAMGLVADVIPEPSVENVQDAIFHAQRILWSMGITGVHDFDRRRCFVALQRLHKQGELGLRVTKSIPVEELHNAIALGLRSGFGDDYLRIGGIKIFADGALGPHTAAMLQPYEEEPENRGMLMVDGEELFEIGREAVKNGLSLAVHAIGDRANHEILDGFTQLREFERKISESWVSKQGAPLMHNSLRHRIEHVQVLHPNDAPRLVELGIIASMQPIHATSDMLMADRYWGERAALSYAWKTQLENGAILAFGSDAPVESPNPWLGIYAAVTRRRVDGAPGPSGWYPEQCITLQQALEGYSVGAAYAAGCEDRLGRLSPGYLADLLVLENDPFYCEPEDLMEIRPLATMIGGEWVHGYPA